MGLHRPMQPHCVILCISFKCPLKMSKGSRSFRLKKKVSYRGCRTGTCTKITALVEQARHKNNIDVTIGWVLLVLCMKCCNYETVLFFGAIPPLLGGGGVVCPDNMMAKTWSRSQIRSQCFGQKPKKLGPRAPARCHPRS